MFRDSLGRVLISLAFLNSLIFIWPDQASAHAFGQLYNLPVPFWLYLYGAAAALLLSFVIIGIFLPHKKEVSFPTFKTRIRLGFLSSGLFLNVARAIFISLLILCILAGLVGVDDSYLNINMNLFWIYFWLGGTYLAAIFGNFFDKINPIKTISILFANWMGNQNNITYPKKLSYWPAFVFYFIFIWFELIGQGGPVNLSLYLLIYTMLNALGTLIFGKKDWFEYCEFFSLYFKLIAKISPIRIEQGKLKICPPFVNLISDHAVNMSLLFFVLFMLSSTAFDGFRETTIWYRFYWSNIDSIIRPVLGAISYQLVQTIGLLLSPFIFFAIYFALMAGTKLLVNTKESTRSLSLKFAYTLIPIAFVYNLAHYYSLLITNGPQIVSLASDPFGFGWNLFGTANIILNFVPDANFTWHSQVAFILIGHIASVFLAHVIAIKLFRDRKSALMSQIPVLFLMVLYTVIGLWILSQPVGL